jgi:hypothetical protein
MEAEDIAREMIVRYLAQSEQPTQVVVRLRDMATRRFLFLGASAEWQRGAQAMAAMTADVLDEMFLRAPNKPGVSGVMLARVNGVIDE